MVTVALPVYACEITWLAMEGLCRQETVHPWELIIYEDEQYPMGADFYKAYQERLLRVGCTEIKYRYSKKRIPLSYKWLDMALDSNPESLGIILQGADNYPQPHRINTAHEKFLDGYEWIYSERILFYSLTKKKTILYSGKDMGIGSDMAICRRLAVNLPREIKWQSVDSWIYNNIKGAKTHIDESPHWIYGLATDGANRISIHRHKQFDEPRPPFYKTNNTPNIPEEIWERIK